MAGGPSFQAIKPSVDIGRREFGSMPVLADDEEGREGVSLAELHVLPAGTFSAHGDEGSGVAGLGRIRAFRG